MPQEPKAIALLSGGLDSSVAMAMALANGWNIVTALTFDYGQRAADREIEHADSIARHFGILHRVLRLDWFRELGKGGGLLEPESTLPQPQFSDLESHTFTSHSAKAVWVPNRNGVFIEIAAQLAEDADASEVIVGFNKEEAQTFPDNSETYLNAISAALSFSTDGKVRVISPTSSLDKVQIVREAKHLSFPLHLLWSCYESRGVMCGRCESCMRLKRALNRNEMLGEIDFEDARLP